MSVTATSPKPFSIKLCNAPTSSMGRNEQLARFKYFFTDKEFKYGYDYTIKITNDEFILVSNQSKILDFIENEFIISSILNKEAFH